MTTQLVVASTLFGAMTAAAAADSGRLGRPDGERVLLVVNNAPAPELTPALDEIPGAGPVQDRFDRVVHLTDLVAPVHPSDWRPGTRELPALERLLRHYWGLGDGPVELVCESIWVNPAQALARVFHDAPVTVYADGLMSYGPTRNPLPLEVAQRLGVLLHLDLVPGLRPVLLSEHGVEPVVVPTAAFRDLVHETAAAGGPAGERQEAGTSPRRAVVVGQYLAALGLMTAEEEADLHADMIRAAVSSGADVVRFKPHPSAPPGMLEPLHRTARDLGVALEVLDDPLPVEVHLDRAEHVAVVGCFSTALATARAIMSTPSVAVGAAGLLERLTPFQNSNRVPLTVIDAVHRPRSPYADVAHLQGLVDTVAHVMQPQTCAALRHGAVTFLAGLPEDERARYFDTSRLTRLELPGGRRRHPVKRAAADAASRLLRMPAFARVDERTRSSAWRRRLARAVGT
ncbi:polysialyltransferase family glycosyltransferase [Isoptericola sp. BMS4]|uniref:polysialyltransferase family glycosyltransferase n=1 Tax=Isoptericola sp. BMS4 TaxID=2527875 RepID=UPI001420BA8C|nr:polysialyltransferase family glycosyltransferase [Isoptericola sp. BMS4]